LKIAIYSKWEYEFQIPNREKNYQPSALTKTFDTKPKSRIEERKAQNETETANRSMNSILKTNKKLKFIITLFLP
jgi:hypothetical protein